jgi:hypothetical protein
MFAKRFLSFVAMLAVAAPFALASPVRAASITVTPSRYKGPEGSAVLFEVIGSGFQPSAAVKVWVRPLNVDPRSPPVRPVQRVITATDKGTISVTVPLWFLTSFTQVQVTATDGTNTAGPVTVRSP